MKYVHVCSFSVERYIPIVRNILIKLKKLDSEPSMHMHISTQMCRGHGNLIISGYIYENIYLYSGSSLSLF